MHPTISASGSYALRFEHPVIAGAAVGGWLNREEDQVAIAPVEVNFQHSFVGFERFHTCVSDDL